MSAADQDPEQSFSTLVRLGTRRGIGVHSGLARMVSDGSVFRAYCQASKGLVTTLHRRRDEFRRHIILG